MMVRISSRRSGAMRYAAVAWPGLVRGDQPLLVVGVADRLAEPDLQGEPRGLASFQFILLSPRRTALTSRLVEELLDHDRGEALRERSPARPVARRVVELVVVGLLDQEVVDQCASDRRWSGRPKVRARSNRPGRTSAGSSESARLVAAMSRMFGRARTFGPRELTVGRKELVDPQRDDSSL